MTRNTVYNNPKRNKDDRHCERHFLEDNNGRNFQGMLCNEASTVGDLIRANKMYYIVSMDKDYKP